MPLTEGQDRAGYVVFAIHDITERRRLHDVLADNEARLRAIFEALTHAILTIDERSVIDSSIPAVTQMFGYTAAELAGQNLRMLMPEPHRSAHDRYLDRGEVYRFINARYQEWFGRSREQLTGQTVREVLGDVGYEERAPYLEGYSREEVIGRSATERGIWSDLELRPELATQLLAQGYLDNVEATPRAKTGELKTVLVSAKIIAGEGARYVLSAWVDVSERRQAEQELRRAHGLIESVTHGLVGNALKFSETGSSSSRTIETLAQTLRRFEQAPGYQE